MCPVYPILFITNSHLFNASGPINTMAFYNQFLELVSEHLIKQTEQIKLKFKFLENKIWQ